MVAFTDPSQDSEGHAWSFTRNADILTPATKKNLSFAAFFYFPPSKVLNLFVDKCSSSRICPARIIFLMGNLMGPPTDRGDHPIGSKGPRDTPSPDVEMQRIGAWCIFIGYLIFKHLFLKIFLLNSLVVSPSGKYQASPHWGKTLLCIFPLYCEPSGHRVCISMFSTVPHQSSSQTRDAL